MMPEQHAVWKLVSEVRQRLLTGMQPDAFDIGFTDALIPGQTAQHAQVHIVPRLNGGRAVSRDGIHWVADDNRA